MTVREITDMIRLGGGSGGGGSAPVLETLTVTANGTYTPEEGVDGFDEVEVNVQGGGSSAPSKDVNFIDYDGTVTNSYTADEFAALAALPDNPVHDGLTAQGWNWSLSDAKAYVAKYGMLDIGQMYITDDGKTRIHIHLEKGLLSPHCGFGLNGTAVIDWGDGSTPDTVTGTSTTTITDTMHTYSAAGDYVVTIASSNGITVSSTSASRGRLIGAGTTSANSNTPYQLCVRHIELGSGVSIGSYGFSGHSCLQTITMPSYLTEIGDYAFYNDMSLSCLIIPDTVVNVYEGLVNTCNSLRCLALSKTSLPNIGTNKGRRMTNCLALVRATIPDYANAIGSYDFAASGLQSVIIPESISTIYSYAFQNCYGLGSIRFTRSTPPYVSSSTTWSSLPSTCTIYVPTGTLTAYTTATNYPSSSTHTYVEY